MTKAQKQTARAVAAARIVIWEQNRIRICDRIEDARKLLEQLKYQSDLCQKEIEIEKVSVKDL